MRTAPIYCTVCAHKTAHEWARHTSGETLLRCAKCWNWTLTGYKQRRRSKQQEFAMFHAPEKKNPRPLAVRDMIKSADARKAAKLLTGFTGRAPTRARVVRQSKPSRVRLQVGTVTAIMYLSQDGGKPVHYIHRFRAGVRPSLVATPDGRSLELHGGAFRFTDRGIVDKRASRTTRRT